MTTALKTLKAVHGLGLRESAAFVLLVCNGNGFKLGEISRITKINPSTLTGIIDGLEKDGYVKRQKDPADRRATIIKTTKQGREAANMIQE